MRTNRTVLAMLAFALALGPAAGAFGTSATFDNRVIAGAGFDFLDQQAPDIGGRYVVYESKNTLDAGAKYQIYVYDRVDGTTAQMMPSAGNQTNARVSNGVVVYEDDTSGTKDARMHDLRSHSDLMLSGGGGEQTGPVYQDSVAVWHDGTQVWMRDMRVPPSVVTTRVPTIVGSQGRLGTSRGFVYYQDDDVFPNVYRYDRSRDNTTDISGPPDGLGNWEGDLAVHDDTVVWRANQFEWPETAIMAFDTRSERETTVAGPNVERQQPAVFGRAFAWVDDSTGVGGVRAQLEGWSAGSVLVTDTSMFGPAVYGNSVVYTQGDDVWLGESPTTVVRVAGANRYATAAEMSERHFSRSPRVVLASGENWPDALSAAGLAGALDCPLLLVRKNSLPAETTAEIARLGASMFMVVGGTAAVSDAVVDAIEAVHGEFSVERVSGVDRYATAVAVSQRVYDITEMSRENSVWYGAAIIVSGESYADALAAAPLSAARHLPILLVKRDELPIATAAELSEDYYRSAVVIGGEAAVSANVQEEAEAFIAPNPGSYETGRWWGANRYETAAAVAESCVQLRLLDL
ncbi:MAG: hypothetical protein FDZ70_08300, partial [Actinobacteria bacterium]